MDVTDRDDGDAGDGDDEFAVFLDAFYYAGGAFVPALSYANKITLGVLRFGFKHLNNLLSVIVLRGCYHDEYIHLAVAYWSGLAGRSIGVYHELVYVLLLKILQPVHGALHKQQSRHEWFLFVLQVATFHAVYCADCVIGFEPSLIDLIYQALGLVPERAQSKPI